MSQVTMNVDDLEGVLIAARNSTDEELIGLALQAIAKEPEIALAMRHRRLGKFWVNKADYDQIRFDAVHKEDKIAAIKHLRSVTGAGLKESKEAVEKEFY